ncbi:hypothetical protein CLONEX_01789 [[Clostridium] nexile DSM 1787]|nr:hypothetical protein CLONEX_01789 [[Clostridium] nexile DSM 1787]
MTFLYFIPKPSPPCLGNYEPPCFSLLFVCLNFNTKQFLSQYFYYILNNFFIFRKLFFCILYEFYTKYNFQKIKERFYFFTFFVKY